MPRTSMTEEETRTLVLDQAVRLIGEFGANKTTIGDIAEACGFSTANVHKVAGTKAEIRLAVCDRMLTARAERARKAVSKTTRAADKLESFVRAVNADTEDGFKNHRRMHAMVSEAAVERWAPVLRYRTRLLDMVREIVTLGVETGEFDVPDVEAAAIGFHMASFRLFHPLMVDELRGAEDAGSIDDFLAFALRGLGAGTASS